MSSSCCICQIPARNGKAIFMESIGDPPKAISDLVINGILQDMSHRYEFTEESIICRKCMDKLLRFYKSTLIAEQLKNELLELMEQGYGEELVFVEVEKKNLPEDEVIVEVVEKIETIESVENEVEEYIKMEFLDETEKEVLGDEYVQHPDIEVYADSFKELDEQSIGDEDDIVEEFFDNMQHSEVGDSEDLNDSSNNDNIGEDKKKRLGKFTEQQCPQCDKIFTNRRDFNAHINKEHFTGYVCDQCGKTLFSYSGFLNHRVTHEPVKKFTCTECGASYHHKQALKHHMAWHGDEKPFQCEICSKQFVHRLGLKRHIIIHDSNSKRIECEVCGNKFRTNAHLTRHMRSHTGAKPFSCPICGKCFTQNYNMTVHIKEHQEPGSTRQKRLRCKKCSRTFTNTNNFKEHCQLGVCTASSPSPPPIVASEVVL